MTPGPDKVVRCGLRGRIGRMRIVSRVLGKTSLLLKGTINFVGRDMMESKGFCSPRQFAPMRERSLEQHIGADDVRIDELCRSVDRPVDMAFCGQMHDRVGI